MRGFGVEAKIEQLGRVALRARRGRGSVGSVGRGGAGAGVRGRTTCPDLFLAEEDLLQEAVVPELFVALGVAEDGVWPGLFVFPDELSLLVEVALADETGPALAAGLGGGARDGEGALLVGIQRHARRRRER